MALEPITRKEKIIAGENLEPITRMEQFLKKFGGSGGGGGGGVTTLHINVTAINMETKEPTFTADKTPMEMLQASANGSTWCVVTFEAGVMSANAVSIGLPPAWLGNIPAFGGSTAFVHDADGGNTISYAVRGGSSDRWLVDVTRFGS